MSKKVLFILLAALLPATVSAAGKADTPATLSRQNNVINLYNISKYKDTKKTGIEAEVIFQLLFEDGQYYLKPTGYSHYIMGCRGTDNNWQVWKNTGWTQASSGEKTALDNIQELLRPASANEKPVEVKKLIGEDDFARLKAYEMSMQDVWLNQSMGRYPAAEQALSPGEKIPASLPVTGSIKTDGKGLSDDIVIVLYKTSISQGAGIVFKRNAGFFNGEAGLFSDSSVASQSYNIKARALLNDFFIDRAGAANALTAVLSDLNITLPEMNGKWGLFSGVSSDKKKEVFDNLATILERSLRASYQMHVNGKTVFGSGITPDAKTTLYGNNRNIYIDLYLLYLMKQNWPVFAGYVRTENDEAAYNPKQYSALSAAEGMELAAAAMKFYTWGAEYGIAKLSPEGISNYKSRNNTSYFRMFYPFRGSLFWDTPWHAKTVDNVNNYWNGQLYGLRFLPEAVTPSKGISGINLSSINNSLFTIPHSTGIAGYPLPYAESGADSPRTFAYKMYEQNRVQAKKKSRVRTTDETTSLSNSYEVTGKDAGDKPFIPGAYLKEQLETMQAAGVDTMGFLTGSIAMTGFFDKVYNLQAERPAVNLDQYYKMDEAALNSMLDSGGKPKFSEGRYPSDWAAFRLTLEDLERCSIIIPDLSLIQPGDLVVRYNPISARNEIGIIIGFSSAKPAFGGNQRDFMNNVIVLSVREGFTQVTMGTWGNPDNTFNGFTTDPENCHVRRLVIRNSVSGNTGGYPSVAWDVCDPVPAEMNVTIKAMKEQTSLEETKIQRWMPNTGEFLLLEEVEPSMKNAAGATLDYFSSGADNLEMVLTGARDRGYVANQVLETDGNIFRNGDCKFEIALIKNNEILSLGELKQKQTDESMYEVIYKEGNVLYTQTGINKNNTNFPANRLWVDEKVCITGIVNGQSGYILGIRPENAKAARPGDDLLLKFGLRKAGEAGVMTVGADKAEAVVGENDYIAVYDKKLVWRANLYIDEEDTDWNNMHPWNAPPGENLKAQGGNPVWGRLTASNASSWDGDRWGYNEWNRKWDGTGTVAESFVGLKDLPVGDGKQVVQYFPVTPIRTLGGTISNPNATNILNNTVAYSYPLHSYEPNSDGEAGSMDSPFDYIKKMLIQKAQLKDWFNDQGLRFVKPKSSWPKANVLDPKAFSSLEQYAENVQAVNTSAVTTWAAEQKKSWYEHELIKNFSLASWKREMQAPNDMWWHYEVSPPEGWNANTYIPATQAFVPGLGLKISTYPWPTGHKFKKHFNHEWDEEFHPPNTTITQMSYLNKEYVIEAGSDCVGLAQRAASYGGNRYKWRDLNPGWTEMNSMAGENNIWIQINAYDPGVNGRVYPIQERSQGSSPVVHTKADYDSATYMISKKENRDSTAEEKAIKLLRNIVPGDIFVKQNDMTDVPNAHIAVVAVVPEYHEGMSAEEFMQGVILVEEDFAENIQSAIRCLTLSEYNANKILQGKRIYSNYTVPVPQGIKPNCETWAIRRIQ
ncbi:hypothetical protein K7I13_09315 [Brucepastera parasyntrophica]|uniref:hypothetical protein n=1 Tax=Brucepastera parasyntrophica TaxID=2880008 RepID=UPI00210E479E|nr:hypothetical protein [Brucepastera parasyntrophica]ULQ58749.1 hypothetical protein K7I13_09315 [Brucepastera parasyntrophica]